MLSLLTDDVSAVLVRGQMRSLIEAGYEIAVGTHRSNPPRLFDEGVGVHHLDFVRQPSPIADLRALVQTIRLIGDVRPSIVHASTPKAAVLGILAARLRRVPVRVYQVRGLRYETTKGLSRALYIWLERLTMAGATHVLFNSASLRSRAEADGLIGVGESTVLGSGNGVDIVRFSPGDAQHRRTTREILDLPHDACVVGYVGRLTKDKGVDDLIEAFTHLQDHSCWLLLVGPFEESDHLDKSTRDAVRAHPRIVHRSWMDDPLTAYRAIDVLAFPSYREGLPNVPLEAQACAVPVVGYAATGTVDAVHHGRTGLLVPVGDRAALASALEELCSNEDRRNALGHEARLWVSESFRQEDAWSRLREILDAALDTSG